MSNLWTQAMPWMVHPKEEGMAADAKHVKDAGFAGFVHSSLYHRIHNLHKPSFNHKIWNESEPDPTDEDFHHFDQHGKFTPEHAKQHEKNYSDAMDKEKARDVPDHFDNELASFQRSTAVFPETWHNFGTKGPVDIKSKPVYATQSHVNQQHINRYKANAGDKSWHEQNGGINTGYEGSKHPLFVTHKGRLHVIEGHHRVAAALQRGDTHIHGWHFDMDAHGSNPGVTEDNWKS